VAALRRLSAAAVPSELPLLRIDDPTTAVLKALFVAAAVAIGLVAGINPPIALALAIAVAFILIVLSDLAVGIALFIFVAFLEVLPLGATPTVSVVKLVGVLLGLSWLAVLAARRDTGEVVELIRAHPAFSGALVLLLAWVVLSVGWAEDESAAKLAILRLTLDFGLFFIFFTALTERRYFVWGFWAYIGGSLTSAMYGLIATQSFDVTGRLSGAGTNANDLAAVLVASLVLSVALAAWYRRRSPILCLTAISAGLMCAVLTFLTLSRAGLLSLGVVMVIAVLIASRQRGKVLVLSMIVVLGVVGYFSFLAPQEARDRVTSIGSGTGRTDIWRIGMRVVDAQPVIGVGAANFPNASQHYLNEPGRIETENKGGQALVAHNIYLETWAELGVVGLVLFLFVLGVPVTATLKAARNFAKAGDGHTEALARALFVAQLAMLSAAFFASIQYNKQLWILLAFGPALMAVSRSTPRETDPA
jgi:O-antigen ligase